MLVEYVPSQSYPPRNLNASSLAARFIGNMFIYWVWVSVSFKVPPVLRTSNLGLLAASNLKFINRNPSSVPMYNYLTQPHPLFYHCQSESSLDALSLVGGLDDLDSEKSKISLLCPASTNLRKHHPICTAVNFSLPSGSTCLALTNMIWFWLSSRSYTLSDEPHAMMPSFDERFCSTACTAERSKPC